MSTITGYHHTSLTVTDLEASARWYEEVFGLKQLLTEDHEGGHALVYLHPESGMLFGLHKHDRNDQTAFHESRTGLDHLCFAVASRDDLVAWTERFDRLGVAYSPITDTAYGSVVVFRDPDNIQLELYAAPAS